MSIMEQQQKAFTLIHDLALKLCGVDGLPPEVRDGLHQIMALANYKQNVLGADPLPKS